MRIAIFDNDPNQAELVCTALRATGHICQPFFNTRDLLLQLRRESYDMLILDWQVADLSVVEVLRQSRDKLPVSMPVLLITSRSGEDDIIAGMEAGANDYLIKPIRRSELVARVQALLRRSYPTTHNVTEQIRFGKYTFEPRTYRLLFNEVGINLTQKEFDLALLFFRNIDRPLSRTFINEVVWTREADVPSRTLDTHVSRVRNKLNLRPENGFRLTPVYAYGYRLETIST
jgi:DNA-binding response OmpR family regulator